MSHGGSGSRSDRRNGTALRHLGLETGSAAWCTIGRIPRPPKEIHAAAGGGALRPAFVRPLGMLGVLLAVIFTPLVLLLAFFSTLEDWADRLLGSKADRARARAKAREAEEQKAAVKAHGLDQLFDGDWTAAAGQFLLRWYGHSSHHKRFLVLTRDRVVLAAPPRRVSVRAEQSDGSAFPRRSRFRKGRRRFSTMSP